MNEIQQATAPDHSLVKIEQGGIRKSLNERIFDLLRNVSIKIKSWISSDLWQDDFVKDLGNPNAIETESIKDDSEKMRHRTWPKKVCWFLFATSVGSFVLELIFRFLLLRKILILGLKKDVMSLLILNIPIGLLILASLFFMLRFDKNCGKMAFVFIIVTYAVQVYAIFQWDAASLGYINSIKILIN